MFCRWQKAGLRRSPAPPVIGSVSHQVPVHGACGGEALVALGEFECFAVGGAPTEFGLTAGALHTDRIVEGTRRNGRACTACAVSSAVRCHLPRKPSVYWGREAR
ncbi:hypothetical protein EASAB2608_07945 [Streptomyces sp. EAS-AB2608]|nr:hypothetical protein EASAB2608_07945 [Streptomyces sp. EAS-AB2608]